MSHETAVAYFDECLDAAGSIEDLRAQLDEMVDEIAERHSQVSTSVDSWAGCSHIPQAPSTKSAVSSVEARDNESRVESLAKLVCDIQSAIDKIGMPEHLFELMTALRDDAHRSMKLARVQQQVSRTDDADRTAEILAILSFNCVCVHEGASTPAESVLVGEITPGTNVAKLVADLETADVPYWMDCQYDNGTIRVQIP